MLEMHPELRAILSRCFEEGQCWIWRGACDGNGRPQMRRNGKVVYVRRVVVELRDGKPVPTRRQASRSCEHEKCVSPHCAVVTDHRGRAKLANNRGAFNRPDRIAKMVATKRAKSLITADMILAIRSARTAKAGSEETGVSLSHCKAIRRGTARREQSMGVFSGLMR